MARRLLTVVSSSTLQRVLCPPVMIRMSTSFIDSTGWIEKMKIRFALLDVDKNGFYDRFWNPAEHNGVGVTDYPETYESFASSIYIFNNY